MPQLPMPIPTDNSLSAFHREFENNYLKMPHLSTPLPTDNSPSVFHREFENNYLKMPHLPTPLPMDNSPLAFHREFENNYLKRPQSPMTLPTKQNRSVSCRLLILPTKSLMDCVNSKGRCIKCISDRVRLLTELPTDSEKYGG